MSEPLKLLRGTVDALVLQVLSSGALHGYGIADWIRRVTDDAIQIDDGALYTALYRMKDRGWLTADWGATEEGHRAKFYELTEVGRRQLRQQHESWTRYADAVAKVFATPRGGSEG